MPDEKPTSTVAKLTLQLWADDEKGNRVLVRETEDKELWAKAMAEMIKVRAW